MEYTCECGCYPTIIIPGIGDCKAFEVDEKGDRLRKAWPPDIDAAATKKLKNALIGPALRMMLFRRDMGFSKRAGEAIAEALDVLSSYPDGTFKHKIEVETYDGPLSELKEEDRKFIYRMLPFKPLADTIGEDHVFYFAFTPIGNTKDTVGRLRDFIKMAKKKSGHDKVNLASVSLGGTITTAYLDTYGDDGDIHRVVGLVPAFDGSVIVSDIMKGEVAWEDYETLFKELLGGKQAEKVNKIAAYIPKKVIGKFVLSIIDAFVKTAIINSSTMWGLVPAAEYPMLSEKYLSDPAHKKLKEETDRYWRVRADFPALVAKGGDRGVEFFSLCGYNKQLFKAVNSSKVSSDMVVHTASCSMGAHIAPLGETLGAGYKQQNLRCADPAHNHLSTDNMVDASCGAMPDTTWYFRDMEHEEAAVNATLLEIAYTLLKDDSLGGVFDNPVYPQFSRFVKEEKRSVPLTAAEVSPAKA